MTAPEREALWRARMTLGLRPEDAWAQFRSTVENGSLLARDPRNGPKPLRIGFNLPDDADHVLYRCSDDIHGRARKGERRPLDFCPSRADRIGWPPTPS